MNIVIVHDVVLPSVKNSASKGRHIYYNIQIQYFITRGTLNHPNPDFYGIIA